MKNIITKILSVKLDKKKTIIALVAVICVSIGFMLFENDYNKEEVGVFTKVKIHENLKQEMIAKNIWHEGCPLPVERLRLLNVSYIDFSGKSVHDGQIIVMDIAAHRVLKIFKTLYDAKFPIASIKLMNYYNGDDFASMTDNNTSSFNCRKTLNGKSISLHAYGLAVDLNPLQNPYIDNEYEIGKEQMKIYPAAGMNYVNRAILKPGMVENNLAIADQKHGTVVELFKDNGFASWGGMWSYPVDLHHFQVAKEKIGKIMDLSPEEALKFFESFTKEQNKSASLE